MKPQENINNAAFDIFIILIDLKIEHPFTTDLLNFNLNIEPLWNLYELAKPVYQPTLKEDPKKKLEKELEITTIPKSTSKDAKIFEDKMKYEKTIFQQQNDDRKTNRTDTDELDSDVSLLSKHENKKKRRFKIC